MPTDMLATFAVIAGIMGFLIWDRFRYDIVAGVGLVVAIALGVVPAKEAFRGFADDIVILVASALVVSAAIERSGVVDMLLRRVAGRLDTVIKQVVVLTTAVALLSAVMKNIGALAVFLPVAFQLARKHGTPPSRLLMPLSFASLLGGIMTLIGTSPNIIVSRLREEMLGAPFGMFSFTPLGLVLTFAGILFLAVGWRLLPLGRSGGSGQPFMVDDYTSEFLLPADALTAVGDVPASMNRAAAPHGTRAAAHRGSVLCLAGGGIDLVLSQIGHLLVELLAL